jgi:hypothetical protein
MGWGNGSGDDCIRNGTRGKRMGGSDGQFSPVTLGKVGVFEAKYGGHILQSGCWGLLKANIFALLVLPFISFRTTCSDGQLSVVTTGRHVHFSKK